MRRFVALVVFLIGVAVPLGCGDSVPTVNTAPNDKQKQKEQAPGPGAGQKK